MGGDTTLMDKTYHITATTQNKLRVLQRIATIFSRLRVNVEELNVYETDIKGISQFKVIILASGPQVVEKILKQLRKVVELIEVYATSVSDTKKLDNA